MYAPVGSNIGAQNHVGTSIRKGYPAIVRGGLNFVVATASFLTLGFALPDFLQPTWIVSPRMPGSNRLAIDAMISLSTTWRNREQFFRLASSIGAEESEILATLNG